MLEEKVIPIDFGQGLDTKTDPKGVVPGKFIRLENGVFTSPKRIAKRNGYTAVGTTIASVGTLSDPQMVHGYGDELIAADQNLLLSYSSNQNAWVSRGNYTSVGLSRNTITTNTNGWSDVATLGNYALYASLTSSAATGSVVDLSTGTVLVTSTILSAVGIQGIKCVCLGGTTLAVIYLDTTSTALKAHTVTFSGSGVVSFSAATTIASNVTSALNAGNTAFDVVATSTGGAFAYTNTSADVVTATLSTALAVATATIATTVGNCCALSISTTSNGNIWTYWTESTTVASDLTALTIYYAVYSSALAVVLARTSIVATATPYYVSAMISKSDSATQQTLYYGVFTTNNAGAARMLELSRYITITSAGVVGSSTLFANGVIPFSRPVTIGSRIYAVFLFRKKDITVTVAGQLTVPDQSTCFLIELTNFSSIPQVVSRFGSGVTRSHGDLYQTVTTIGNLAEFSSTKVYFTCGLVVQANSEALVPLTGDFVNGSTAVFSYLFDFDHADAWMAINNSNVAILNGGLTKIYDGNSCSEFNFHLYPEITNLTQGAAGTIADGAYSYIAIFQWIDSHGNLHQSTPSPAVAITVALGVGVASVTATITTNFLSDKQNATVSLFRTVASGSIYYLIGNVVGTSVSPSTNAITTIVDTLSDANLIAYTQAYTFPASDIIENTTPPPSMVMTTHNNRLFFVDAENPTTDVWYTKSNQPLVGVSPSGFMVEQYDPKFGKIVALAEMDEKIVALKEKGFIIQAGDGVTDAGNGSTFSLPQAVPSDVGCSSQKSVVLTPEGLLFKSPNGIYLLNRSLNVGYMGAEVEIYNSQDITGATLVPGKSQIRFLTSSGYTLVYDYIFKQWGTFTNHAGNSSTAWNGLYVYATTTGNVFKESAGSYLDNATAFALLAQTSWLALASVQGFQRVRRLAMLGDFINGNSASHNLSISAAYDFSTTFQSAITYAFGAASASGAFEYRERLPIQKCAAISLLIQETTTGSALEYVDLTNISFEAAVKRGLNKLRGQQSVG